MAHEIIKINSSYNKTNAFFDQNILAIKRNKPDYCLRVGLPANYKAVKMSMAILYDTGYNMPNISNSQH